MSGEGHPLPESEEARHNEVPEPDAARKGEGDEGRKAVQATRPVNPDGEPYDAGRSRARAALQSGVIE